MERPPNVRAFTLEHSGIARVLITTVEVGMAFDPATSDSPQYHEFEAIWDTGATNCAISQRVVDACRLKPIGMAKVTHAQGVSTCEVFFDGSDTTEWALFPISPGDKRRIRFRRGYEGAGKNWTTFGPCRG